VAHQKSGIGISFCSGLFYLVEAFFVGIFCTVAQNNLRHRFKVGLRPIFGGIFTVLLVALWLGISLVNFQNFIFKINIRKPSQKSGLCRFAHMLRFIISYK